MTWRGPRFSTNSIYCRTPSTVQFSLSGRLSYPTRAPFPFTVGAMKLPAKSLPHIHTTSLSQEYNNSNSSSISINSPQPSNKHHQQCPQTPGDPGLRFARPALETQQSCPPRAGSASFRSGVPLHGPNASIYRRGGRSGVLAAVPRGGSCRWGRHLRAVGVVSGSRK